VGSAALEGTNEKVPVALPPGIAVRECARVELEDAARLRAEAYYEDSSGRYVETFKRHFVRQETDSLRTRTAVSPNGFPECVCLVAVWEGSGQVVGTLDIRPPAGSVGSTRLHRDGRYLNGVPVGVPKGSYVLNVCVSEERRGSGIGTALMREACKEARRRWGAQEMFTEVDTWNDSAYSLYSRVGFQRYSPDGTPLPAATPGARARHMLHLSLSQVATVEGAAAALKE
jgi:ribosomal protein S18 acetylase RimI-like enzyme